ncbi:MAG: DUF664 domain-containing protein [Streptosporangiaceae bacterium]|jgi:hypothetical protein
MTSTEEHGEPVPFPFALDEAGTVLAGLDRMRAVVEWKCGGLDAAAMNKTLGPSTMTLGGLVKHLAFTEEGHFATHWHGRQPGPPWDAVDWDADEDWEWHSAAVDSPEELMGLWRAAVDRSRKDVDEALASASPGGLGRLKTPDGHSPNLRYILVSLLEEYARHVGHIDLIRESLDGTVGEDPPERP